MFNLKLKIAQVHILILADFKIDVSKRFEKFISFDNDCDYTIVLSKTAVLETFKSKDLNTDYNRSICIYKKDNQLIQSINRAIVGTIANCYYVNDSIMKVFYIEEEYFSSLDRLFEHIGIETIMFRFNAFFLHASLIDYYNTGIAFIGESGVGKSTRADLWHKYANAEIINGDKTLLRKVNGKWIASGSPFAGSSQYYVNKDVEIKSLVLIERGTDEQIELYRVKQINAFKQLYANTTITLWNEDCLNRTIPLLEDVSNNVFIYKMICPPDRRVVDILKKELMLD